ncbi:hypothetical protein [Enterococcus sp. 5H]|uniref:hypothetical protein n=1 Tax=Enterococcus sp. 5H TaxID=1229490 RepID=UPI002302ED7D|nr:hypothetical protein [Enterococcus sp. 5H]
MRKSFNFRNVFKKPIMIPEFDFWKPNQPIPLRRLLIAFPLFGLFWLIKVVLLTPLFWALFSNTTVSVLYYAGMIYYFSGLLTEEHDYFEDKNVYLFIKDYWYYQWKIRKKRRVYAMDEPVTGLEKNIRFKKTIL